MGTVTPLASLGRLVFPWAEGSISADEVHPPEPLAGAGLARADTRMDPPQPVAGLAGALMPSPPAGAGVSVRRSSCGWSVH
jgi:hypothetical protein